MIKALHGVRNRRRVDASEMRTEQGLEILHARAFQVGGVGEDLCDDRSAGFGVLPKLNLDH
ncbi:MAG: hypothetical protein ACR2MU_06210, partial [Gaiellaceae bacterium]